MSLRVHRQQDSGRVENPFELIHPANQLVPAAGVIAIRPRADTDGTTFCLPALTLSTPASP